MTSKWNTPFGRIQIPALIDNTNLMSLLFINELKVND